MPAETRPKLISQLTEKIVTTHARKLTNTDVMNVSELLSKNKVEDLMLLTELLSRNPETFVYITEKLIPYIVSKGKILKETKEFIENPEEYVKALIKLKKEMDELIAKTFFNKERFVTANTIAFQDIMELFELTPKYLALYIDHLMRKELRGNEHNMEELNGEVFDLFKTLKSKDSFTDSHNVIWELL